ncbi:unnamed protein product [Prorocentrum cordatum]|uniref:Uncharacterized protein n=1 Tax=Prorocentrum cordatum TaxID=2364126 RepID=A0ABN9T3J0_9DINO|nr:unnamed protein product [Polarella glacialis]
MGWWTAQDTLRVNVWRGRQGRWRSSLYGLTWSWPPGAARSPPPGPARIRARLALLLSPRLLCGAQVTTAAAGPEVAAARLPEPVAGPAAPEGVQGGAVAGGPRRRGEAQGHGQQLAVAIILAPGAASPSAGGAPAGLAPQVSKSSGSASGSKSQPGLGAAVESDSGSGAALPFFVGSSRRARREPRRRRRPCGAASGTAGIARPLGRQRRRQEQRAAGRPPLQGEEGPGRCCGRHRGSGRGALGGAANALGARGSP